MSRRQLAVLATVAAVLLLVAVIKGLLNKTPSLSEEYDLKALAPENFLVSDAARLEMYKGSKQEEKIDLRRKDEQWTITSKFNAPADKKKVEDFIAKLKSLEGEFRAEKRDVLSDFNLEDEKALHFVVYRKDSEEPWYHLLVGKKEDYQHSFVRLASEETVYTVNVNLGSEIGVWGDDKQPEAAHWLDKEIVDIAKEKITRLTLQSPDRSLAFERREKETEEAKEPADAEGEEKKPKEHEWVLAEGGIGKEFKQSGLDDILKALGPFQAEDVEDPAKKEELGLGAPQFRAVVTLEDEKETTILAGQSEPGKDAYVMVQGGEVVWKVADWRFDDLFPEASNLFELQGLDLDEDDITELSLTYSGGTVKFEKKEDTWEISSPRTTLKLNSSEIEDSTRALASWKPVDYADGKDLAALGLDEPYARVEFALKDGTVHRLTVGDKARVADGRFVLLDDNEQVWTAGKWEFKRILPELKDLFERDLLSASDKDITKVVISGPEEFVLALDSRDDGRPWIELPAKGEIPADEAKVRDYLQAVADIQASDTAFASSVAVPDKHMMIKLEIKGQPPAILRLGEEKESNFPVKRNGDAFALLIPKADRDKLVPDPESLLPEVPAQEETAAPSEVPEEGAAPSDTPQQPAPKQEPANPPAEQEEPETTPEPAE